VEVRFLDAEDRTLRAVSVPLYRVADLDGDSASFSAIVSLPGEVWRGVRRVVHAAPGSASVGVELR
jgi:hypothetical protein